MEVLVECRPSSGYKICFEGNFHSFLFCISSSLVSGIFVFFSSLFGKKCDKREEIGDLINKGPSTAGVYGTWLADDCKSRHLRKHPGPKVLEC